MAASEKNQKVINDLLRRMGVGEEKARTNGHANGDGPPHLSGEEIIELCRRAQNAPGFEALFDRGDISAYNYDICGRNRH